ncbi:Do family serine endopeptidase [Nitrogeniibacter mangrovi]|uniref:Probable periplasmic serine endoprotease DegP-like n=1 Tax=Nitrogeniibacter mangrovi TaxID=2016596 RepID=A0A6C1B4R8_9RHOO|nr:Do family serine endopeptidase [Nitrogeniibacter mangrovi]QID17768.1 Do family serine endopeptidase [Nitrogeniibacter mangrovi]
MPERSAGRALLKWALLWLICLPALAGAADLPDFRALVRAEGATVVNIQADRPSLADTETAGSSGGIPEWLKRLEPEHPDVPEPRDDEGPAVGSGFILSQDGYILTNAHVIDGASALRVRLNDKRAFRAAVVGADRDSDIALIKIDATGLPVVRLGDPEALEVGEWVVAIGSPFGFEQSVTAGIISARGRVFPQESYVPFIQTDVAINPGNSGGPLFNLKGEVVGINSQIYSRTGGFMGVSFSIPIDLAMRIADQLKSSGEVRRGRIGVSIQEVTPHIARAFALDRLEGALVGTVEPDSPADRAGVKSGDVIVRFDDVVVRGSDDLPRIVGAVKPGSEVSMDIWRQGKRMSMPVTVGVWQHDSDTMMVPMQSRPEPPHLGLDVSVPNRAELVGRGARAGLLVEAASGPALAANLAPGDLLVATVRNGRLNSLGSVEALDVAIRSLADGEALVLLVQRGGGRSYVAIERP